MDWTTALNELKSELKKTAQELILTQGKGMEDKMGAFNVKLVEMEAKLNQMKKKGSPVKLKVFSESEQDTAVKFLEWVSLLKNPQKKDEARAILKDVAGAMNETTDADGGALVPDEFRPVLIRLIDLYGVIRQNATIIPMSSETMTVPKLTTGLTLYWVGENKTITPSKPVFDKVNLTAKKLAALVPITGELMQDSTIELSNLLVNLVAEAIAAEEDRVGFVGDSGGTDPFDGILYEAGTVEKSLADGSVDFIDLTYDDLIGMPSGLKKSARTGSAFYMHPTILDVVKKLKDKEDRYIWTSPGNGYPGTIAGFPYEEIDQMPDITETAVDTPFICFGNLKNFFVGDRQTISIATSEAAGFADFVTFIRFIVRESLTVAVPEAFVILKTAAA